MDLLDKADRETDLAKAEAMYSNILDVNPDLPEVYCGRALVRTKLEKWQPALEDINQAIMLNRDEAKYFAQRAYIYVQIAGYNRALRDYEKAVQLAPGRADYYSGLSYTQHKLGQYDEAEKTAQKGISLDPKSPYSYRNRGRSRMQKGSVDAAISDFNMSLKLQHRQPWRVWCDLGEASLKKGEYQRAADYFKQALQLKEDYLDAMIGQQEVKKKLSGMVPSGSTFSGRRVALLIGNSTYSHINSLDGQPLNDAAKMDEKLTTLGFSTHTVKNVTHQQMHEALQAFNLQAKGADVALVFYAGHGMEYRGGNYLLPTNVHITADSLELCALSLNSLIDQIQLQQPRYFVVILDACRTEPLAIVDSSKSLAIKEVVKTDDALLKGHRGFKVVEVENRIRNCFIAMATAPNTTAKNGPRTNGYFTEALLKHLQKGKRLDDIMFTVRNDVITETKKTGLIQQPEYIGRIIEILIL